MRARTGLRLVDAAARLDMSTSALHRLETGETLANVHVVRSMMDLYDHYSPNLLDLVRTSRSQGWWRAYGVFDDYIGWETDAAQMCEVATTRIPDLLQVDDYARATGSDGRALSVLKARQSRLTVLRLNVVISEAVITHDVPGVDLRAQIAHLSRQSELSTVAIRVLPAAETARMQPTPLRLLDYPHPDPCVAFVDSALGRTQTDELRDTVAVRRTFESIAAAAMTPRETRDFLSRINR
ncbi:helix-turn-helix protein [Labedaea rhizosphaerae]|uniref:Helix-turn-helix protein n=2 Tax=Labedaea rhizosphaerae TaxID=598644 RepID=A0A4R6SKY1_LABRH|nr:helix-turn-helix protein [Labedaea rhizosphaerae]